MCKNIILFTGLQIEDFITNNLTKIPLQFNTADVCKQMLDDSNLSFKTFIANIYKNQNYLTMFVEDWSRGMYTYDCKGFNRQMTDYYMR